MKTVGTFDGKTHFSQLVSEAEAGETIIITRKGRPVAQLCPLAPTTDTLSADEALARILSRSHTLGVSIRTLLEEGRRG